MKAVHLFMAIMLVGLTSCKEKEVLSSAQLMQQKLSPLVTAQTTLYLHVREEGIIITYTVKPGSYTFFSDGYLGAVGAMYNLAQVVKYIATPGTDRIDIYFS